MNDRSRAVDAERPEPTNETEEEIRRDGTPAGWVWTSSLYDWLTDEQRAERAAWLARPEPPIEHTDCPHSPDGVTSPMCWETWKGKRYWGWQKIELHMQRHHGHWIKAGEGWDQS